MQSSTRPTFCRSIDRVAAGDLLRLCVGVLLVVLLVDTWCLGGLLAPLVVVSPSMTPTLYGPHAQWNCAECGRRQQCDLESFTRGLEFRCPDCGTPAELGEARLVSGDRVLVDRATYCWREPKRFEIVVAQNPDDPSTLCVKRVVGLPGESLRIADGRVWHDGQPLTGAAHDAHYVGSDLSAVLAEDEYYLLGDNSVCSRDSRDWSAVPARWIVGRAMHWSMIDSLSRASR
jgi:signal peptidase I